MTAAAATACTEVVVATSGIDASAADIRREHAAAFVCARATLEHAFRVGEMLTLVQPAVIEQLGYWEKWVVSECGISERQAAKYMRLWKYRDRIEPGMSITVADRSISKSAPRALAPEPMPPATSGAEPKLKSKTRTKGKGGPVNPVKFLENAVLEVDAIERSLTGGCNQGVWSYEVVIDRITPAQARALLDWQRNSMRRLSKAMNAVNRKLKERAAE